MSWHWQLSELEWVVDVPCQSLSHPPSTSPNALEFQWSGSQHTPISSRHHLRSPSPHHVSQDHLSHPGEHDVLLPLGRRSRPSAVEICHGEDLQSAIHYKVPCAMDIAIGNMPSPGHCWQVCMWICSAYQLLLANILNICQDNNKNLGKQSSTHKNKSVWGPWPCGPPEGHPTFASASIFKKDNVLHPRCMEPNEEMASSCQECHGDTG